MHKLFGLFVVFLLQGCAGILLGSTLSGAYFASNFTSVSEAKDEYSIERKINAELNALKKLKEEADFDIDIIVYITANIMFYL